MRTVVDIGGQDVKVIEIENGMMKNFVMNDKCAAGTGRFLDVMARVLEVKVEELGDLGDKSTKEVGISSTCTVFAESEVISQLAMGTNKCDIIHGIHKSVAGRVPASATASVCARRGDDRRCRTEPRHRESPSGAARPRDPHHAPHAV